MVKRVTVTIKPVAWAGDKVTMYQAYASWQANKDRTIQLIGEPCRTEDGAFRKLEEECELYNVFLRLANNAVMEYKSKCKKSAR